MQEPRVVVESYCGHKGEQTPRSLTFDGKTVTITEIMERWHTETHCYFRARGSDAHRYVLRYELDEGLWELVMQERPADTQEGPPSRRAF